MISRPGGDQVAHDRSAAARERTTHDRDAVSALRDEGADARLQTADDRDRSAVRRDRGAEARDALARLHDQQSDADASPVDIVVRAERDRARGG